MPLRSEQICHVFIASLKFDQRTGAVLKLMFCIQNHRPPKILKNQNFIKIGFGPKSASKSPQRGPGQGASGAHILCAPSQTRPDHDPCEKTIHFEQKPFEFQGEKVAKPLQVNPSFPNARFQPMQDSVGSPPGLGHLQGILLYRIHPTSPPLPLKKTFP